MTRSWLVGAPFVLTLRSELILSFPPAEWHPIKSSRTDPAEHDFLRPRDAANPPSVLARHHDADGGVEERVFLERYGVVQDLRTAA